MKLLTADHKSQWRAQPALEAWEEAERLRCASEDEDEKTNWAGALSAARERPTLWHGAATATVPTISLGGPGTGNSFRYDMSGTCEVTIDNAHLRFNFERHCTTNV
eukprot:SAG31_NODE_1228_length_9228_cov_5.337386_7_plen_106_part_00